MFFLLGTVVFAVNISDMMSVVAIGVAQEERSAFAISGTIHKPLGDLMHSANVLPVNAYGVQAERACAHSNFAGRGLGVMRVFRIKIVLAHIDHGQLEKLREVHYFVKHALAERAFSDEAYCHATIAQTLRRKSCASGDSGAAAHDGIRSEVAGGGVCDMHGTALALAVS